MAICDNCSKYLGTIIMNRRVLDYDTCLDCKPNKNIDIGHVNYQINIGARFTGLVSYQEAIQENKVKDRNFKQHAQDFKQKEHLRLEKVLTNVLNDKGF